jgi:hypothetical protein
LDIGTFSQRLRELNPNLYIDTNHRTHSTGSSEGTSGIYLRNRQAAPIAAYGLGRGYVSGAESENSSPDKYVGWVQHGYIPEGDIFNSDTGQVICQGWRTIVRRLLAAGLVSSQKACKAFGYTESWYDRLQYNERLTLFKKEND